MKNSTKLAIAALMAGSLSLSSLPVADAQETDTHITTPKATKDFDGKTGYLNTTDPDEPFYVSDPTHIHSPRPEAEQVGVVLGVATAADANPDNNVTGTDTKPPATNNEDEEVGAPAKTKVVDGVTYYLNETGAEPFYVSDSALWNTPRAQVPANKILGYVDPAINGEFGALPKTKEINGTTCYLNETGETPFYVKDRNLWNTARGDIKDASQICEATTPGAPGSSNAAAAAGLVAGLAGLGLLIGGVWHFLNKDGKTLVPSKDRINAEPTAEEKKKSEELLQKHGADIKQKTDAAKANPAEAGKAADIDTTGVTKTAPRGMAAETGNNTVARGMAAVAVMALLGAVAFFARRRFVA